MQRNMCVVNNQLAMLLRLSRIFGVAPVDIAKFSNNYTITLSPKYATLSFALNLPLTISLFVTYLVIFNLTTISEPVIQSSTSSTMMAFEIIITIILLTVATYDGLKRMDRIILFLNKIKEINASMDSIYTNIRLKRTAVIYCALIFILLDFVIFAIYLIVFFSFGVGHIKEHNWHALLFGALHVLVTISMSLITLQYIFMFCLVKETFSIFNQRFRCLIVEASSGLPTLTVPRSRTEHFYYVYMSLYNVIVDINNQHSSILLFLFLSFVESILNVIYLIMTTCTPFTLTMYSLMICGVEILQLVYKCIKFIIFVEACHRIKEQIMDVRNVVSEIINVRSSLAKQLNCFVLSFGLYTPAICPFGIFNITRGLLIAVLGVATTVLLIISQFNIRDEVSKY